jgi:ribosomal protein S27E
MPFQKHVICAICQDELLGGFDDLGHAHTVVRLHKCGEFLSVLCYFTIRY